jgi:hypothetical protein
MLIIIPSKGRAWRIQAAGGKISSLRLDIAVSLNPPSGNGLLNYAFVIARNAPASEFESVSFRTNSS